MLLGGILDPDPEFALESWIPMAFALGFIGLRFRGVDTRIAQQCRHGNKCPVGSPSEASALWLKHAGYSQRNATTGVPTATSASHYLHSHNGVIQASRYLLLAAPTIPLSRAQHAKDTKASKQPSPSSHVRHTCTAVSTCSVHLSSQFS